MVNAGRDDKRQKEKHEEETKKRSNGNQRLKKSITKYKQIHGRH